MTINISQIRWTSKFSDEEFEKYLYSEATGEISRGAKSVILACLNDTALRLYEALKDMVQNVAICDCGELKGKEAPRGALCLDSFKTISKPYDVIVACTTSAKKVKTILREVLNHEFTRHAQFIYKIRASETYPLLNEYDRFKEDFFISSLFDDGEFEDIYRKSLERVELKCQVRDAFDLYQFLLQTRKVEGDIAEFGSYKGHSGLLISEIAKRYSFGKQIFLCDTFDVFPAEDLGIDRFWSKTHQVDYERVRELFKNYPEVKLVKGDFEDTIDSISAKLYSFVYVDCDSYRAVKFVTDKILPKLNKGGIIIYEDYGHEWCLGAREAVDELFENSESYFKFFSFFSGLYVVMKVA